MDQDKEMKAKSAGSQASPQPAAEEAAMRTSYLPPLMTAQPSNSGEMGMTGWGPGGWPASSGPGMMPNAGPGNPGMGMPTSGQPAPSGMMPGEPFPPGYSGPAGPGMNPASWQQQLAYHYNAMFGRMGMPYGWLYGMPFNPNLICPPYYNGYGWPFYGGGYGGGMMMPFCPPAMPQQHCGCGGRHHGHSMCGCRPCCCRRSPCQRGCRCC